MTQYTHSPYTDLDFINFPSSSFRDEILSIFPELVDLTEDHQCVEKLFLLLDDEEAKNVRFAILAFAFLHYEPAAEKITLLLDHGDAGVTLCATIFLGELHYEPAAEKITLLLDHWDCQVISFAACALAFLHYQPAAEKMMHLFDHEDTFVNCTAAIALAWLNYQPAAEKIIPLLDYKDAHAQACAIYALGLLHYEPSAEKITQLLDHEYAEVKANAAVAVSKFQYQPALEKVLRFLDSEDTTLRIGAAVATGFFKYKPAVEKLRGFMNQEDEILFLCAVRSYSILQMGTSTQTGTIHKKIVTRLVGLLEEGRFRSNVSWILNHLPTILDRPSDDFLRLLLTLYGASNEELRTLAWDVATHPWMDENVKPVVQREISREIYVRNRLWINKQQVDELLDALPTVTWEMFVENPTLKQPACKWSDLLTEIPKCSKNRFIHYIRKHFEVADHRRKPTDLEVASGESRKTIRVTHSPTDPIDLASFDESYGVDTVRAIELHDALNSLTDRECHMVKARVFDGLVLRELADQFGCTISVCDKTIKTAMEKLKLQLT